MLTDYHTRRIFVNGQGLVVHVWWEVIKTIYWGGLGIAVLLTLLVSRDTIKIRLLTSGIIGFTWPMSLPVVLLFSLF